MARSLRVVVLDLPEFANELPDKERDWYREKYRNGKNGRVAFGWLHRFLEYSMKRLLVILALAAPAFAKDIYLAQTAQGAGTGVSCATALVYTYFNSSGNWGAGSSQISPGTTVHLCGTIGASSGSTVLTFQASGTSGNITTLHFESGASLQEAYFGSGGAININGQSYVTVDGGTNGFIEATSNGTSGSSACPSGSCSNQQNSQGIEGCGSNCTIQNLTIADMYVKTSSTDEAANTLSVDCIDVGSNGNALSNVVVNNNIEHDCLNGILFQYGTSGGSNLTFSNNTIYNVNWAMGSAGYSGVNYDSFFIFGNHTYNLSVWDDTVNDDFHHNAIHFYQGNNTASTISHIYIYNNEFDGPVGDCCVTAQIYVDNNGTQTGFTNSYVFNNVFSYASTDCTATCGNGLLNVSSGNGWTVVNNTFIGDATSNSVVGECMQFYDISGSVYENNINTRCNEIIEAKSGASFSTLNYNLYTNSSGGEFIWQGTDYSTSQFSNWQTASGADANSHYYSADAVPLCSGNTNCSNVIPASGSTAVGFGANLTSICTGQPTPGLGALCSDKAGNARPASGAWTAGAYNQAAQFTITSPTASSTVSGFLPITISSAPAATYSVTIYFTSSNGGTVIQDSLHTAGISRSAPYTVNWNTNYAWNSPYLTLQAVARDALNNVLATSAAVVVTLGNIFPVPLSVYSWTVTAPSSPWSGTKSITATGAGTDLLASAGPDDYFIDGYRLVGGVVNSCSVSGSGYSAVSINSAVYENGPRNVRFIARDCNHFTQAGTASSNSNTLTVSGSTTPSGATITVGQSVIGTGISLGTTVSSVSGTSVTLSLPTSAAVSGTISFGLQLAQDYVVAEWEQVVNFNNVSTPMALWMEPGYEVFLCTTAQTSCPTSITFTGRVVNTDINTVPTDYAAATFPSGPTVGQWVNYPTTPVTVGACSSCTSVTVTAQAVGSVYLTFTESGGQVSRPIWVHVNTANHAYNFSTTTGTINTDYNSTSILPNAPFAQSGAGPGVSSCSGAQSNTNFNDPFYPAAFVYANDLAATNFNTAEFGVPGVSSAGTSTGESQATFTTGLTNATCAIASFLSGTNLYWEAQISSWFSSDSALAALSGPSSGQGTGPWSSPAMTVAINALLGTRILALGFADEISNNYASRPVEGGSWQSISSTPPGMITSAACVSGTICTFTCANAAQPTYANAMASGCDFNNNNKIVITGSGTALDFSTTSGAPTPYSITCTAQQPNLGCATFTFPNPGVGNLTLNATTNAGLTVSYYSPHTYADPFTVGGSHCEGTAGPCPFWAQNNVWVQALTQIRSVSGHPLFALDPIGTSQPISVQNWTDPQVVDFPFVYNANNANHTFMPGEAGSMNYNSSNSNSFGYQLRQWYSAMGPSRLVPMGVEGAGITQSYAINGYSATVASCVGNTITFSGTNQLGTIGHGITNIDPFNTRLTIAGNSNPNCNGQWYVTAAPTNLTLNVVYAAFTFAAKVPYPVTAGSWSGGTATLTIGGNSLAVSGTITVSGVNPSAYNGTYTVTAQSSTTVSYAIASNPGTWVSGGRVASSLSYLGDAQDGSTFTINSSANADAITSATSVGNSNEVHGPSAAPCVIATKRGQTFTIDPTTPTGTAFDTTTMWLVPYPRGSNPTGAGNTCGAPSSLGLMAQVPALTSGTGGTATILLGENFIKGVNWSIDPADTGPRIGFNSFVTGVMGGAKLFRNYEVGVYFDIQSLNQVFSSTSVLNIQSGIHPRYTQYGQTQALWNSIGMAAGLIDRLLPVLFQPNSSRPDYGQYFESDVTVGPNGNLLMVNSLADNTMSRTISLTYVDSSGTTQPLAPSGQTIVKYCAGWAAIAVSTITSTGTSTTDAASFNPDQCSVIAYVYSTASSPWYSPPTISARLADIPNATHIAVQWTYSALQFNAPQINNSTQYQVYDLGGASGTAPIDSGIPYWYRLLYLNPSNAVVSSGSWQH